jgi:hypothetical protein
MELPNLRAAAGVAAKLLTAEAEDMFSETRFAEASIEVRGGRRLTALDRHAKMDLCNYEAAAAEHKRQEAGTQKIHDAGVALLVGVENCAVPDINPILETDSDAYQDQQANREGLPNQQS